MSIYDSASTKKWVIVSCPVLLVCLVPQSVSWAEGLMGRVLDGLGQPISGVTVKVVSPRASEVISGQNGEFSLPSVAEVLLIEHPSFAPAFIKPSQAGSDALVVSLNARSGVEWKVPPCAGVRPSDNPLKELRIRFPRRFTRQKVSDVDSKMVLISDRRSKAELRFWLRTVSYGMPTGAFFSASKDIVARPLNLAETRGYDVRATMFNGKVSRWAGVFYTFVVYENVDPSVARELDVAIDGMCYH